MMVKKIYKVQGMDCPSCATLLECDLEDMGVKKASCNYASETLEIEFDPKKIKEKELQEKVKSSGYKITD